MDTPWKFNISPFPAGTFEDDDFALPVWWDMLVSLGGKHTLSALLNYSYSEHPGMSDNSGFVDLFHGFLGIFWRNSEGVHFGVEFWACWFSKLEKFYLVNIYR